MKSITDKIIKSDFVNWRNLEIIQPKGFKELSKPAYQKLRNSIIENNFVESFKVWDNGKTYLLDGVHRCKVLDILDSEGFDIPDKFRADFIECKDKKQAKKMILVYSSRYAKLLEEGLYEFVQDLDWDAIARVTDFADIDIDRFTDGYMRDTEGLTDEDEIPEVTEALTKTGDLWLMGEHRVLCGDATKEENVDRLMDGNKADMVFTDPPYGYRYESNHQKSHKMLKNDDVILDFISMANQFTKKQSTLYLCTSHKVVEKWKPLIVGFIYKNMIVWKKNNWSMGDLTGSFAGQYELILFASKGNPQIIGERTTDIWSFDRVPPKLHPTMKPVELIQFAFSKWQSSKVLDLFLGSGSTLIACEKTNRKCYGLEIDEHYCDVIVKRWEDFTGKTAILDG